MNEKSIIVIFIKETVDPARIEIGIKENKHKKQFEINLFSIINKSFNYQSLNKNLAF